MSRDDDFSGDGAVDPRLNELLSDYRQFLDEVPAGESMPEDVALNIREAIAREPMPSSTKTPVNRSMLALAASVAVIGIGIGATVIVTNQPDVQQEPIRASAVDDGSTGDGAGATTQPLPSNDFTIALSATDGDGAGVIVPTDVQPGDELAVVFALEGPESEAAQEVTKLCGKDSKRVGVVLPDVTSNSSDQDSAQAQLDAVTLVREELSDYAGISDAWYAVGDVSSGDPVIVAGVQQGLLEPITDITASSSRRSTRWINPASSSEPNALSTAATAAPASASRVTKQMLCSLDAWEIMTTLTPASARAEKRRPATPSRPINPLPSRLTRATSSMVEMPRTALPPFPASWVITVPASSGRKVLRTTTGIPRSEAGCSECGCTISAPKYASSCAAFAAG